MEARRNNGVYVDNPIHIHTQIIVRIPVDREVIPSVYRRRPTRLQRDPVGIRTVAAVKKTKLV